MTMKAVTYRGKQMTQIMERIRERHGDEAYILSTREFPDRTFEVQVGIAEQHPGLIRLQEVVEPNPTETNNQEQSIQNLDLRQILHTQQLSPSTIQQLLQSPGRSDDTLVDFVTRGVSSVWKFDPRLGKMTDGPRVVALVGPTGAGKTTTIAKLAARMRMAFDARIGLLSADSFRIGAAAQLHSYATLLKVPCRSLDSQTLEAALKEFRSMDLVLIDTAGCSPRDNERLQQIQKLLGSKEKVERILVLPATAHEHNLDAVMKAFGTLGCRRAIITKLDETVSIGTTLNCVQRASLPMAFLCTGQSVPEDIEPASARRLGWVLSTQIH